MPTVPDINMVGPTGPASRSPLLEKPSQTQMLMAAAALSQQSGQGGTPRRETKLQKKTSLKVKA